MHLYVSNIRTTLIKSKIRGVCLLKGFNFGACHESQFGRENGNAIDVAKGTEGSLFYVFMILK